MQHNTTSQVPVTLLTGFLGSGKTTLANRILSEQHNQRIAVIVNEFGEAGIDGRLVIGVEDNIIELSNGCLCCTVRGDLVETLRGLLRRRQQAAGDAVPFERILIETSGLASPGPAVQTLLADPVLAAHLQVDGVITLVHAQHIVQQLHEHPEASEQIAYADHIIVNHCDQSDPAGLAQAEAAIRACNHQATLERTSQARVAVDTLLQTHTWEIVTLQDRRPTEFATHEHAGHDHDGHTHTQPHTCGVGTLTLKMTDALDLNRLKLWLLFISKRRSHTLMRYKGILRCQQHAQAIVVQGVYQWFEVRPGAEIAPQESVLVLIGRDLDASELQREWADCRARA